MLAARSQHRSALEIALGLKKKSESGLRKPCRHWNPVSAC
jgi:hypothetical protein